MDTKESKHTIVVPKPPVIRQPVQKMDEGKKRVGADIFTAVVQDEQLRVLKQMLKTQERQIPRGQTKAMTLYIVGGGSMIHLDFLDTKLCNFPRIHTTNVNWKQVNIPQSLLFNLNIINLGPGRVLLDTNIETNSTQAGSELTTGREITVGSNWPSIRTMNILAPDAGADATVNLIGFV